MSKIELPPYVRVTVRVFATTSKDSETGADSVVEVKNLAGIDENTMTEVFDFALNRLRDVAIPGTNWRLMTADEVEEYLRLEDEEDIDGEDVELEDSEGSTS